MPNVVNRAKRHFIQVGYGDKIEFTAKHGAQERPELRATWQQSQGLWTDHPVFRGLPISDVIVWLRGEDSDV